MATHSIPKLIQGLLEGLNPRQREIIAGRFGLEKFAEPQTLAALGDRYGITRERVRQIEASTTNTLREKLRATPALVDIVERSKKCIKSKGGVMGTPALVEHVRSFADGVNEASLSFLASVSGELQFRAEDEAFLPFYYAEPAHLKVASQTIDQLVKFLRARREETFTEGYAAQAKQFVKQAKANPNHLETFGSISKKLGENPYGDRGLTEWPEVQPSTIRDRIYLVLKKEGKPLHFEAITHAINKAGFESRKALVPTVHNELIKDRRFVLVGRGIYALAEHGYEPGTAKEVIHRVLKKQGALAPQQVILAVQNERFFKANTVLANLQNKNIFRRRDDGKYEVRES